MTQSLTEQRIEAIAKAILRYIPGSEIHNPTSATAIEWEQSHADIMARVIIEADPLTKLCEWRSMDSAPRDGSSIIVSYGAFTGTAFFCKEISDFSFGQMESDGSYIPASEITALKYWMPLPNSPETKDL